MKLNFERYKDPKDAMGVGLKATSLRLSSVIAGPIGNSVPDESVHQMLETLASGDIDNYTWHLAKRFRWSISTGDIKNLESFGINIFWILQLSGAMIEFRGKYYKMPKFKES